MDSYIRKFKPNLKHIIGAVLVVIGLFSLVSGIADAVKAANPKRLDELSEEQLEYGTYVTGTLDDILLYGYLNGSFTMLPVDAMTVNSRSDPIKSADILAASVCGKYCGVYVDGGVTPELYDYMTKGVYISSPQKREFTGVIIGLDYEALIDYINSIDGEFYCGGKSINDLTSENCLELTIHVTDPEKEKNNWITGLLLLIIGAVLLVFGGNPYFYVSDKLMEEQTSGNTQI